MLDLFLNILLALICGAVFTFIEYEAIGKGDPKWKWKRKFLAYSGGVILYILLKYLFNL
jgi:hypothetical protein